MSFKTVNCNCTNPITETSFFPIGQWNLLYSNHIRKPNYLMEIAPIMDPITNFMGVAFGAAHAFEHTKLCIVIKDSSRLSQYIFILNS